MKIAFASCMDATRVGRQPVWSRIREEDPDVLMLIGDQIYMDWGDLGASGWKRAIDRRGDKAIEAFARDMHMRYEAQAAVPEFRALIQAHRAGAGRPLLLTWDDHDFAWNNAEGAGEATGAHHVPERIKRISRQLMRQFESHLLAGASGDYPAFDESVLAAAPPGSGIERFEVVEAAGQSLPVALLDTRWYRTPRPADSQAGSILGPQQWDRLADWLSRPEGLLLVVGGSPMKHKYLFSEQDWHTPHDGCYPEYARLIETAARPVLFVGGDIHRNSWGAEVRLAANRPSRVLQILSSGAAIANAGPVRFAPSFGLLEIEGDPGGGGRVLPRLLSLNRAGQWVDQPPVPALPFGLEGWTGNFLGEASGEDSYLASIPATDPRPLAVLCRRARRPQARRDSVVSCDIGETGQLDAIYEDGLPAFGSHPEPLSVVAVSESRMEVRLEGNILNGNRRDVELEELMDRSFARAADDGRRSVALFVHGFGKSFADAVEQGYGLRFEYPQCEPVVFAWPAGRGGGFLGALLGFGAAEAAANSQLMIDALSASLAAFARAAARHPALTAVVVARSAGAIALARAMAGQTARFNEILAPVTRIVLSSPALKTGEFNATGGFNAFAGLPVPKFVTVNAHDQSLRYKDFIDGFGDTIGKDLPQAGQFVAGTTYLDFTDSPGVGRLHDYLFPEVNAAQREVHRALLCERAFAAAAQPGLSPHPALGAPVYKVGG